MFQPAQRKTLEEEVLGILNSITPKNFDISLQKMREINIETYDDLQRLVQIFFDKVTTETKSVEILAQLCKYMSALRVAPPASSAIKENQATFRVVMLTKCQQEFEADKTIIFEDPREKQKKIEAEMPDTPERATLIKNTLYQMKLRRLKFYGNIRFIGELFKLGMLTENIMHDCIYRLLKAKNDNSLLSLCSLITTVGQNLDTKKAKLRMDSYFIQMAKLAEERKSRIKDVLKGVSNLRNNNWAKHMKHGVLENIEKIIRLDSETQGLPVEDEESCRRAGSSQDSKKHGDRFLVLKSVLNHRGTTACPALKEETLSPEEEKLKLAVKVILNNYESRTDFKKTKRGLWDMVDTDHHQDVVITTIITEVQEKFNKDMDIFGSFFHDMIKDFLPLDVYIRGIAKVLLCSGGGDRKMWTDLACFIVPSILGGSVSLFTLSVTLKYDLPKQSLAQLVGEILLIVKEKTSERKAADIWRDSGLSWAVFLDPEELSQFLVEKKLEFTVNPAGSSQPSE